MGSVKTENLLDTGMILEKIRMLRQGYLSIEQLKIIRSYILEDELLSSLLNDVQSQRLREVEAKVELFHSLFGFWGRALARTEAVTSREDADKLITDLCSDDTCDVVRAYHIVYDNVD